MQNVNIKSQQETKEVLHRGLHFQKAGNAGPMTPMDFLEMSTPMVNFLCLLLRLDVKLFSNQSLSRQRSASL